MWSKYPQLSATQVARRIEVTADDPPATMPSRKLGWGTIDPVAALTAAVPAAVAIASATPKPLPQLALPQLALPPPPDHTARNRAFAGGGAVAGLAALIAAAAATVRAGRARSAPRAR